MRPGLYGFGAAAEGGAGRGRGDTKHFFVEHPGPSGPGSLAYIADHLPSDGTPWMIHAETSGTITGDGADQHYLRIKRPNGHINFASAPGEGLQLRNYRLKVQASEIYMACVRAAIGDGPVRFGNPDDWRSIELRSNGAMIENIVMDHCTWAFAIDQNGDFSRYAENVLSWACDWLYPLRRSLHSKGAHDKALLSGSRNTAFIRNLFYSHARNPEHYGPHWLMHNCVVYNAQTNKVLIREMSTYNHHADEKMQRIDFLGNVHLPGPINPSGSLRLAKLRPMVEEKKKGELDMDARIYCPEDQNISCYKDQKPDGMAGWPHIAKDSTDYDNIVGSQRYKATRPNFDFDGQNILDVSETLDWVRRYAGACPSARVGYQRRAYDELPPDAATVKRCGAGRRIDRPEWPRIAVEKRPLTELRQRINNGSANAVQASGYTWAEEMVHRQVAAQVGAAG